VLRTIFKPRGVDVLATKQVSEGLAILRNSHPNVVVLDLDEGHSDTESVQADFEQESRRHDARLVLLGRAARRLQTADRGCSLAKPYHYGPLIRTIETLLERR
jgi:ActR/RegA family two-component response regulator